MTNTGRQLVEAGAIDMATYWHNSWETMAPEPKVMYLTASRAALIATFRKLAEDGPIEAMLDAACPHYVAPHIAEAVSREMSKALLRELEGLTP